MQGKITELCRFNGNKISISDILAICYIIISLLNFSDSITVYLKPILFLIWLTSILVFEKQGLMFLNNKILISFGLFIIYVFVTGFVSKSYSTSFNISIGLMLDLSSIVLFYYFIYNKKYNSLKLASGLSLIVILYCSIVAYIRFSNNMNMPIVLASDSTAYGLIFVGEIYGLFYGLAVLCSFIASLLFSKKIHSSATRLILSLCLIIFTLSIYKSRSSLTFIICIVGILTSIIFSGVYNNKDKSFAKKIIIGLIIIWIFFLLIFDKRLVGNVIMSIANPRNSKMLNRLYSVGEHLSGIYTENTSSGFNSRIILMLNSLKTFLRYPLFGINYITGGDYFKAINVGFGGHSHLFDTIAMYGILGTSFYLYALVLHFRMFLKYYNKEVSAVWILVVIALCIVNPYNGFSPYFIQFFLIPSTYILIKENSFENICSTLRFSKQI